MSFEFTKENIDLLREGNVLYTKDNKNILDLLAQGREVPEDFNQDVSNNNIPSTKDSGKRSDTEYLDLARRYESGDKSVEADLRKAY